MFKLPPLPYAENALEPVISARTIGFHYGKHHQAYVDNLNKHIKGTEFEGQSLEAIVRATAGKPGKVDVFNNAAQVWNHAFYWNSLRSGGGGKPTGELAARIDESFNGYEAFKKALVEACEKQFGTGWAWLVAEGGELAVVKTGDAETPLTEGQTPLLTIDVWEHAYYLDYQNRKPDYAKAVIDKLLNWSFAEENLARARVRA